MEKNCRCCKRAKGSRGRTLNNFFRSFPPKLNPPARTCNFERCFSYEKLFGETSANPSPIFFVASAAAAVACLSRFCRGEARLFPRTAVSLKPSGRDEGGNARPSNDNEKQTWVSIGDLTTGERGGGDVRFSPRRPAIRRTDGPHAGRGIERGEEEEGEADDIIALLLTTTAASRFLVFPIL